MIDLCRPIPLDILSNKEKVWYDEACQQLVVRDGNFYLSVSLKEGGKDSPRINLGGAGREVLLARFSLGNRALLALQLNSTTVEVVDVRDGVDDVGVVPGSGSRKVWSIECKHPNVNSILSGGVIWSEHGGNSQDLVLVTRIGLELHKISAKRDQCKLSHALICDSVQNFWYEPVQRLLLLGTGASGNHMRGYWLCFEAPDRLRLALPKPESVPNFKIILPAGREVLGKEHASLLCIHGRCALVRSSLRHVEGGRVYCVCVNEIAGLSHLLLLERGMTKVELKHTVRMPFWSPPICSVVDNLLCLHFPESEVSVAYDIHGAVNPPSRGGHWSGGRTILGPGLVQAWHEPVSPARPIGIANDALLPSTDLLPSVNPSEAVWSKTVGTASVSASTDAAMASPLPMLSLMRGDDVTAKKVRVEQSMRRGGPGLFLGGGGWRLLLPCWVVNVEESTVWELCLDLTSVVVGGAGGVSDDGRMMNFLRRRGGEVRGGGRKTGDAACSRFHIGKRALSVDDGVLHVPFSTASKSGSSLEDQELLGSTPSSAAIADGAQGKKCALAPMPLGMVVSYENVGKLSPFSFSLLGSGRRAKHGSPELTKLLILQKLQGLVAGRPSLPKISTIFHSIVEPYARGVAAAKAKATMKVSFPTEDSGSSNSWGVGNTSRGGQHASGNGVGSKGGGEDRVGDDWNEQFWQAWTGSRESKEPNCLQEEHSEGLLCEVMESIMRGRRGADVSTPGVGYDNFSVGEGGKVEALSVRDVRCPQGEVILLQSEIFVGVFLRLLGSNGEDAVRTDLSYVASVAVEFMLSLEALSIRIAPYIPQLIVRLLARERGQEGELTQLLECRVLPDSPELAACLLRLCGYEGFPDGLSQGRQRLEQGQMLTTQECEESVTSRDQLVSAGTVNGAGRDKEMAEIGVPDRASRREDAAARLEDAALQSAVGMLCRMGRSWTAVKVLLRRGRLTRAVRLLSLLDVRNGQSGSSGSEAERSLGWDGGGGQCGKGVGRCDGEVGAWKSEHPTPTEWFSAAVREASLMPPLLSDRGNGHTGARLSVFTTLHSALLQWDPGVIMHEEGAMGRARAVAAGRSALALEVVTFPDELFPSEVGCLLRNMFGFPEFGASA